MASQPVCSSSPFSCGYSYDVFLSFRGADTRYGFTGHLYKALCDKGIRTFIDDEDLQRGEEITPSLAKAIEGSRIAIPVFSTNYASSSFCLDELVNIIECFKAYGRLVLPVFYEVDPSDVRYQNGSYEKAMAKHEERFKDDTEKVKKWREALSQVANLSGYHFKHGTEYEHNFIGEIVGAVSEKVKRSVLPIADYPVGVEYQMSKVTSLLDVGSNDGVHMVGIHGIGGIGKTTLALAIYNSIADHFEGLCFLENVRENSNKNGLVHLQNITLAELLEEKKIKIIGIQQGISTLKHRLHDKKVLLILDDVDKQKQLQAIAGKPDWFGPGSIIIITTRDKHLLVSHGVERTYEVEGLNVSEALKLLSWKAFKTINVNPIYMYVLNRAVTYACGLPLALEVIGSNLFKKSIEEWESVLDRYENIPNDEIHEILKVSFDGLKEDEQSIFLDIACCFKGYELLEVEEILHAHHGSCMKYHIGVLIEKSLVKIDLFGIVTLHDLIEDMGKEIVRQESPKKPWKRSRLWFHKDIVQVLKHNQGTDEIEIIHLDFPPSGEEKVQWDGKAFKTMKNLKTLIIRKSHFSKGPKYLPNSLRVLKWSRYPSQSLPYNFDPKNLSIFKLPDYCGMSFNLACSPKKFVKLKVLNFDYNQYLTEIPEVSGAPNLEKLSFQNCENLTTIHNSVGFLDKLKILNALKCSKLRRFPPIKLSSLEALHLSYCSSLENFPEILGKMENITRLDLKGTMMKELPFSFRNLTQLRQLYLEDWKTYWKISLPSSIVMMPELTEIIAHGLLGWPSPTLDEGNETVSSVVSSNVERLHLKLCMLSDGDFLMGLAWFANVKELDLSYSYVLRLPACIEECRFLWNLRVDNCRYLREMRGIPPNLKHFSALNCESLTISSTSMSSNQDLHEAGNTMFILPGSRVPEWFDHCSWGPLISFWFRNKFPALAFCLALGDRSSSFRLCVLINGNKRFLGSEPHEFRTHMDHIFLFDLQKVIFKDNLDEVLLENEWNHAEISLTAATKLSHVEREIPPRRFTKESGIHVFKQKSTMEDIRFTDPYKRKKLIR